MSALPLRARWVILVVSLLGLGLWLALLPALRPLERQLALTALLFLMLALFTEFLSVPMLRVGVVSISTIVHVAGILLLPLPVVTALAGLAVLAQQLATRVAWYRATFNTASVVLTVAAAALAAEVLGNPLLLTATQPILSVASLFLVALVYYVVTSNLLALLASALTGRPYRYVLLGNVYLAATLELASAVIGGLLGFVWYHSPWWTLAMLVPAGVAYLALRYLHRVVTETDSAVETIAQIIDERDHYTFQHSHHVAEYSGLLAQAMRLPPQEVDAVVSAARVHDLGKIGVGNKALYKTGDLDAVERAEMQAHPVIGARILGHFEGYRKGVAYILHHHERWDGKGYPRGLKGEAIPLGARIIAVADAFDAMTTTRPYRRALPLEEAFGRLRAASGTQLDPVAVGHFLALEARIRAILEARQELPPARGPLPVPPLEGATAPVPSSERLDGDLTHSLDATLPAP